MSKEWKINGAKVRYPSGEGVLVVADPDVNGVVVVKDESGEYRRVASVALSPNFILEPPRMQRCDLVNEDTTHVTLKVPKSEKHRIRVTSKLPRHAIAFGHVKPYGHLMKSCNQVEFHQCVGRYQAMANEDGLCLVMYIDTLWYEFYGVPNVQKH